MPPSDQHSIERRNNQRGYTPKNCYWATRSQQARNKRNNRFVTYQGRRQLLVAWAEEVRIPYKELHRRIVSRGWSAHRAFTTPIKE